MSTDEASEDASSERPGVWQLAFPSILGNLSFAIVGMAQTKFIAELGAEGLAAAGAGQRIFYAMQAVLMAVSVGTTALVARAWGAQDYREASRVTMASLVMGGAIAFVIGILGLVFARPFAALFGLDTLALDMAAENIRWLSVFNVAFALTFVLSAALRASGDAWTPLWIGIAVNVLNLPLMYMFIFGKYGMPEMGVAGTAMAAGISFSVGSLIMLLLWLRQKFRIKHVSSGWWRKERLRQLLSIGYPSVIEQGVIQLGFFVFLMIIGNYYGTEAFAAYNIGVNMLALCMTVGFGFSIAGATLVGQNLGANDPDAAARSGWRAGIYAILSMGLLGAIIVAFSDELAHFFIGDQPLTLKYTLEFLYILAAMMPLLAVDFAIGGALRGAGDTRFPLIATILGLLIVRCGLAGLFTYMGLPVVYVYAAIIGDYVLKSSLLLWRFHRGKWKKAIS